MWNDVKNKLSQRMGLRPAVEELKRSLYVMNTNAPINEREGNLEQAKLERSNAESYKKAIQLLT